MVSIRIIMRRCTETDKQVAFVQICMIISNAQNVCIIWF